MLCGGERSPSKHKKKYCCFVSFVEPNGTTSVVVVSHPCIKMSSSLLFHNRFNKVVIKRFPFFFGIRLKINIFMHPLEIIWCKHLQRKEIQYWLQICINFFKAWQQWGQNQDALQVGGGKKNTTSWLWLWEDVSKVEHLVETNVF